MFSYSNPNWYPVQEIRRDQVVDWSQADETCLCTQHIYNRYWYNFIISSLLLNFYEVILELLLKTLVDTNNLRYQSKPKFLISTSFDVFLTRNQTHIFPKFHYFLKEAFWFRFNFGKNCEFLSWKKWI